MAEMKFNCPSCNQLIACDELWIGQEIQCPMCANSLTVPNEQPAAAHNPLVPKPPPGGAARLSIGQARHQPSAVAPQAVRTAPQKGKKQAGSGRAKTLAIWGGVLVALAAGVYFGWPYLQKYQDKLNSKRHEAEKNSDGGEVGHIASLNNVLDATDPGRPGGPRLPSDVGRVSRQVGGQGKFPAPSGQPAAPGQPTPGGGTNLPVVPSSYSMDLATAKIPEGRVNGTISGTNFVADLVRVDPSGGAYVFSAVQGTVLSPDLAVRIYLHLKPGEKLTNHTWKITPDMTGGPAIVKVWKSNPKVAAQTKSFTSGYALNLELDEIKDGQIAGKIYLAFPDTEQSYAAGMFVAQTTIGGTPTQATAAMIPAPAAATPVQNPAEKAAFDKRYGIGGKR